MVDNLLNKNPSSPVDVNTSPTTQDNKQPEAQKQPTVPNSQVQTKGESKLGFVASVFAIGAAANWRGFIVSKGIYPPSKESSRPVI